MSLAEDIAATTPSAACSCISSGLWPAAPVTGGEVISPLENQTRRRLARVLRLSLLTFLEDHELDAEEMTDVFEMLQNYATAVWASS